MKNIEYPVEMFQWHKTDSLGNTQVEIRDKNHMTVFYMRINGREYLESKRFQDELAPLIVRLMNDSQCERVAPAFPPPVQDSVISNGNAPNLIEPPKRRGRPPKVKA